MRDQAVVHPLTLLVIEVSFYSIRLVVDITSSAGAHLVACGNEENDILLELFERLRLVVEELPEKLIELTSELRAVSSDRHVVALIAIGIAIIVTSVMCLCQVLTNIRWR